MEEAIVSKSPQETQEVARNFAKKLQDSSIVLLYGNLGAGKTTFVQGLAKGLGVAKRIISPTFMIVRTYSRHSGEQSDSRIKEGSWTSPSTMSSGPNGQDDVVNFYHVDLYRLTQEKEIEGIGLTEIMGKENTVTVIEWPERLGAFKPEKRIEIYFEVIDEQERKIIIKHYE